MRKSFWMGAAASLLVLMGCSSKQQPLQPQQQIIGTWQTTDNKGDPRTCEFTKEGTLLIPLSYGGTEEAKYRLVGTDDIEVDMQLALGPVQTRRGKVAFESEAMTFAFEDGATQTFVRVK